MNKDYRQIKYIILDVDGTLTDGGIYYDENGNETKKFSVKDAAGFFIAHALGVKIVVLTGRTSAITERRMSELHADLIFQGVRNKYEFLKNFIDKHSILKQEICYIGDDLNDLKAMSLSGVIACPKDSCKEIIKIADIVSEKDGGNGAFRDIVEQMFDAVGEWENKASEVFAGGI